MLPNVDQTVENMDCNPLLKQHHLKIIEETEEDDLDILVEDYDLAIAALRSFPAEWDMQEDGGARVAHWINVGGCPVKFDIRFVGDNFFHHKWQKDMLDTRRYLGEAPDAGFWSLDLEHEFWSVIYHKMINDGGITEKYHSRLRTLDPFDNLDFITAPHGIQFEILEKFVRESGYGYIAPRDYSESFLAIQFSDAVGTGAFPKRISDFRINGLDPRRLWKYMHGVGFEELSFAHKTFWVKDHPLTVYLETRKDEYYFEHWQYRLHPFMDVSNRNYTAQRFDDLCSSIKEAGYDHKKGVVLLDRHNVLVDGAHRLACAYHLFGPDFVVFAKYSDFEISKIE